MTRLYCCLFALLLAALPAAAQESGWDIYVYGGVQTALPSDVSGSDENGPPFSFGVDWEGRSFEAPPYYGGRVMRRLGDSPWSLGVEVTHLKVYGDDDALDSSGFSVLEFTDGHNIATVNAERTLFEQGRWRARGGVGLGLAFPYVEVTTPGGEDTRGYQLTGPAARWYLGADYELTDRWSLFAEYAGTYSINEAELEGGGSLESDIVTNALNIGIGFSF